MRRRAGKAQPERLGALVPQVFGELGLPFALESGQTLDRSAALAALVGLVRLDVEDWPFRGLLAVLSNNYFQPDWPEWQDGLAAVVAERAIRDLQIPCGRARLLEQLKREASSPSTGGEGEYAPTDEVARVLGQSAIEVVVRPSGRIESQTGGIVRNGAVIFRVPILELLTLSEERVYRVVFVT